jgi:prepilin-type N-terminal cleavage/methylation domain-containing protein
MTTGVLENQIIRWLLKAQRRRNQGFTLLELLVSMIIASIIVSALLFLVTELNRLNGREELLTQTQQDMRRALDFMSSDVGESVYVYENPTDVVAQLGDDAPDVDDDDIEAILAFWRLDPVDTTGLGDCDDFANDARQAECDALKVRQNQYTLVVYFQENNLEDDPIWEGQSRIIRYQLPKYTSVANAISTLDRREGYLDPSLGEAAGESNFENWESDGDTAGDSQTLVDFVQRFIPDEDTPRDCETTFNIEVPDDEPDAVIRTPELSNSFFVCIRNGNSEASVAGFNDGLLNRQNQSVFVSLTGNAARAENDILVNAASDASRLPSLEAEIFIRGVIEKPRE